MGCDCLARAVGGQAHDLCAGQGGTSGGRVALPNCVPPRSPKTAKSFVEFLGSRDPTQALPRMDGPSEFRDGHIFGERCVFFKRWRNTESSVLNVYGRKEAASCAGHARHFAAMASAAAKAAPQLAHSSGTSSHISRI